MTEGPGASLDGPRIRLRRPRPEDGDLLFEWYNDPAIVAPFDRFELSSREEFESDLDRALQDPTALGPRFVVERKEDATLLGFVGHYRAHPVLSLTDIWYVLGRTEARNQGFGSEAVGLLVDHLFQSTDLPRVGATSDIENTASYRLLERVGFRREGELREALF
ncbi:MAG: GNAT family N-acetyltransferase, partial [Thermoplasmata archaeon]